MRQWLAIGLGLWIARWAAMEIAALVGRRRPPGPPPIDSPRQPGVMPGPFDR